MLDTDLSEIRRWAVTAGLSGAGDHALLAEFCRRLLAAGLPLSRANVAMDTLHPLHEGRLLLWYADERADGGVIDVGHAESREALREAWKRSPFYHLRQSGEMMLRRRLTGNEPDDFSVLAELREEGHTDYVVQLQHFTSAGAVGEMDCVNVSWATQDPRGFSDDDIAVLHDLLPSLALALKSVSLQRITATLVETYLGRDAGRRVLDGRIERGVAERVRAVIWFSDLKGFTRITDTAPPEHILPFLNEYADAIISSIHEAGGDVLKLIGDGTLAIFTGGRDRGACERALEATTIMRSRIATLNEIRETSGLFVTEAYVGLHLGEVFYGNVGASDRLDFTVIGPAVNMASRISAMCRSAERDVLMSDDFVRGLVEMPRNVVSVGRYALRGFDRPQELFTMLPEQAVASVVAPA